MKRNSQGLLVFLLASFLAFGVGCGEDENENQSEEEDECTVETQDDDCTGDQVCTDGQCVDEEEDDACSADNPTGVCTGDLVCTDGECVDDEEDNACSADNPTGVCTGGQVCTDGECVDDTSDLCSADNPTGSCTDGQVCTDGQCADLEPAADSDASALRANLTALLQEHVYLAAIAINTALQAGGDLTDDSVGAAIATLQTNSEAIAGVIGSVYGNEAEAEFLSAWESHIGFFVDYTLGVVTEDQDGVDQAVADLGGYIVSSSAFLDEATEGRLDSDTLEASFQEHIDTLVAAVDALIAGDTEVFNLLRDAAAHMPHVAAALSGAVADQFDIEGDTESGGAALRSGLTALLQEHVYLAGITISTAASVEVPEGESPLDQPLVQAAVAALDANSVALSDAVASVYDQDAADGFLTQWRAHIGYFVDYVLGLAGQDGPAVTQAQEDLAGYATAAGTFYEDATGGILVAADVEASVNTHVATLLAAIDAALDGDTAQFDLLADAAHHMSGLAAVLASAFNQQFPDEFQN